MAIEAKFTRTLPAPTTTISSGFVFLLSAAWFEDADLGAAGSPIDGGTNSLANGGGDMQIFSDTAATTRLPIEVVTFVTGGTPDAQVWVRTPSYTSGDTITIGKDDTQISQPAVGAAFGRNAVYVDDPVRFHLEEDPSGSAPQMINSSGGTDGTTSGSMTSGDLVAAQIENGLALDGTDDQIDFGTDEFITSSAPFTISLWINPDTITGFLGVLSLKNIENDDFRVFISDHSSYKNISFGAGSGTFIRLKSDAVISTTMQRIDIVFDGVSSSAASSFKLYRNAVISTITTSDNFGVANQTNNVLGRQQVNRAPGIYDEFVISNYEKTADYITDEYTNQNDPDNFGTSSEWILVGGGGITLTGTAVPTQTESDIVTGGKTIILTLTGDTFVTGSSSEDGIAGGSDSDIAASGTNWDSLIKTDLDNTNVVLSVGDTVATITLPAYASYDIPATETITWTIPAASLTTSTSEIIATPTHTVTPTAAGGTISPYFYTNLLAS